MKRYIRSTSIDEIDPFNSDATDRAHLAEFTDDVELLEIYAKDPVADVRLHVVFNDHVTPGILEELAKDPVDEIRKHVAYNTKTPAVTVLGLAQDDSENVRFASAFNPNMPEEGFKLLLQDETPVRGAVTQNRNLPYSMQMYIAKSSDPYIRQQLARRKSNIPPEVLTLLADDPEEDVRYEVAINSSTPEAVLKKLTDDPSERVRRNAVHTYIWAL